MDIDKVRKILTITRTLLVFLGVCLHEQVLTAQFIHKFASTQHG